MMQAITIINLFLYASYTTWIAITAESHGQQRNSDKRRFNEFTHHGSAKMSPFLQERRETSHGYPHWSRSFRTHELAVTKKPQSDLRRWLELNIISIQILSESLANPNSVKFRLNVTVDWKNVKKYENSLNHDHDITQQPHHQDLHQKGSSFTDAVLKRQRPFLCTKHYFTAENDTLLQLLSSVTEKLSSHRTNVECFVLNISVSIDHSIEEADFMQVKQMKLLLASGKDRRRLYRTSCCCCLSDNKLTLICVPCSLSSRESFTGMSDQRNLLRDNVHYYLDGGQRTLENRRKRSLESQRKFVRNRSIFDGELADFTSERLRVSRSDSIAKQFVLSDDSDSPKVRYSGLIKPQNYKISLLKLLPFYAMKGTGRRRRRRRKKRQATNLISTSTSAPVRKVKSKTSFYSRISERKKKELIYLIATLKQSRSKDPLWALLSIVVLMVVMFCAMWICGMKRIDRTHEIHVDVEDSFHTVGIRDIVKSRSEFLPKNIFKDKFQKYFSAKNIFKSRHKRKRYHRLRTEESSEAYSSDNSEDEREIYAQNMNIDF